MLLKMLISKIEQQGFYKQMQMVSWGIATIEATKAVSSVKISGVQVEQA